MIVIKVVRIICASRVRRCFLPCHCHRNVLHDPSSRNSRSGDGYWVVIPNYGCLDYQAWVSAERFVWRSAPDIPIQIFRSSDQMLWWWVCLQCHPSWQLRKIRHCPLQYSRIYNEPCLTLKVSTALMGLFHRWSCFQSSALVTRRRVKSLEFSQQSIPN